MFDFPTSIVPELKADVIERENDFQVHVDLPGVNKEDVELTVANGMVHIKAERSQSHEEKSEFSHKIERSYGVTQRSVPIPANAAEDTADATFNNGVLTVQFNKKATAPQSQKLAIKSEATEAK